METSSLLAGPQLQVQDNRVSHAGWNLTPEILLGYYVTAEQGNPRTQCDALEDIVERDLTLASLLDSRTEAVAGKPTVIQPGGDDSDSRKYADAFRAEVWEQLDTQALMRHQQANSQFHGWAASETTWAFVPEYGRVNPVHFHHARCRDFYIASLYNRRVEGALPDELLVRASDLDFVGQRLIPGKWIVTRRTHRVPLAKAGLGRGSALLALLKGMSVADWAIFIHRFGLPFVLATINDFTNASERAQAEAIIRAVGADGGAIKAEQSIKSLEFMDAVSMSRNSASDVHQRLAQWVDTQMAKLWSGAALVTESGDGAHSYAQASAQMPRFDSRVVADTQRIERVVRDQLIIPWWRQNNLPGVPARLKFHLVQPGDPREAAEVASIMVNDLGLPVSKAHMFEITGFREASGADDVVPGRVAAAGAGTEAGNAD